MSDKKLKPCFCGRTPEIVTRDVEPQEDRFFSGKAIMFVLCECGQCLFDGAFHEGFSDEEDAANAWNYRVASSPAPDAVVDALVALVVDSIEEIEDWAWYCPEIFKMKHKYEERVSELRARLSTLTKGAKE